MLDLMICDTGKVMGRPAILFVLLTILLMTSGCFGAFTPDEDDGELAEYIELEPDEEEELRCEGVTLSVDRGQPLSRIDVNFEFEGEEPDGFGVELKLTGDDDDDPFLPVYRDEDGYYFSAPPHPDGIDGGDMELFFTDGVVSCEDPVGLEIEALPEAPGTIEDLIKESSELARTLIRSFGYEPEDIVDADIDEIPAVLIPMAVQLWSLDHPDNPDSLLARLQADDLPVDHAEEDLIFAEALLAASGHVGNLEARQEVVQELVDETEVTVGFVGSADLLRQDVDEQQQGLCSPVEGLLEVEINNDQDLSYYMRKAHRAVAHGERVERVSTVVGVLGTIPGPSSVAAAIVSLVMVVDQLMTNAHTDIYPRDLVDPQVEGLTTDFAEDFTERGRWDSYSVTAEAPGWDATADIVDALISSVFAIKSLPKGAFSMPTNVGQRLTRYLDDFAQKAASELIEELGGNIKTWIAENALSAVNGHVLGESGLCMIETGPWPDITILNTSWLEIEYEGAVAGLLGGDDAGDFCRPGSVPTSMREYEPTQTGVGSVKIEPSHAQFPSRTPEDAAFFEHIDVNPIEVVVDPQERMGFPGQEMTIEGTIENAENQQGEWLHDDLEEISTETPTDGPQRITVRLPDSADDFPVFMKLNSVSNTGLRSSECDPYARAQLVVIRSEEALDIVPRHRCIPEDGSLQMEAVAATEDPGAQVQWSSSSGSIDESGYFEADSRGGVDITATVEGTELEETATIRVGACGCFFDVRVDHLGMNVSGYDHIAAAQIDQTFNVNMGDPDEEIGAGILREAGAGDFEEDALATVTNEPTLGMLATIAADGTFSTSRSGSRVRGGFGGTGAHLGEFFAILNDAGQPIPQERQVSISFIAPVGSLTSIPGDGACN